MREVGAQLRAVRLERGEDLDDVAKQLRIKAAYLFGIEQGDLSALPGRTYALGFLRTYADYLGFDGADLIARIKSSVGDLTDPTRLRVRAPMPENRLPRTPMVVISLALVAGIYLGWSYFNRTSRMAMDTVAEVPEDLRPATAVVGPQGTPAIEEALAARSDAAGGAGGDATAAGVPDAAPAATLDPGASGATVAARPSPSAPAAPAGASDDAPDQTTAGAPPPAQPSADDRLARSDQDALSLQPAAGAASSGAPSGAMADEPGLAAAQQAAAAASAADRAEPADAAAEPDEALAVDPARRAVALLLTPAADDGGARVYERANTDARVILRAHAPSWVQVSSPAGDYTFTRTLEPGEAVLVPNRRDLELWTGNAHGLEIIVDGAPVALATGPMVRRNISLDPDRLRGAPDRPH